MTAEAPIKGSFVKALFYEEPAGTFMEGHIFTRAPDLTDVREDPSLGYWRCDVADHERLTWSDRVYELFGLSPGAPVERRWAVERYSEQSKRALKSVRTYALGRKLGFILDAQIEPDGAGSRWIRVLAVPMIDDGRVVGLHGLKRAL